MKDTYVRARTTNDLKDKFKSYADKENTTMSALIEKYMTKCVKQSKQ